MPRIKTLFPALALALGGSGCALEGPRAGTPVAPGVAQARFEVRDNGADLLQVDVAFPAAADGTPLPGRHPGLVLIQGGLVAADRYLWQARALAGRGYVVAVPRHLLDLAIFAIDDGAAARRLLVTPPPRSALDGTVDPGRLALVGHSLGGVVALKLALAGGYRAVALEASRPDPADFETLPRLGLPTLSLAGSADCTAPLAAVRTGWEQLPAPTALQVLPGVTHFQFTDAQTEDDQRGCVPAIGLEAAHALMVDSLAGFLDGALADGGVGLEALRAVPGAQTEVRP